ncbi:unnamed protein product [Orchesella dallaii]|uniref:F-box domain-containing protein n=1 Tax=Orchesella dallaii TaxID=48710 RepID=A0ABP1RUW8_9HEXA
MKDSPSSKNNPNRNCVSVSERRKESKIEAPPHPKNQGTSMDKEETPTRLSQRDCKHLPALPLEMWEEILKDLSPIDFLAVINTCPQWRESLESNKTAALFPLILPILGEQIKMICCHVKNTFLTWRAVNRGARRAVNKLACAESSSFKKYYERVTAESTNAVNRYSLTCQQNELIKRGKTEILFEERIADFLQHFTAESTPSPSLREFEHPFFSGAVTLCIENKGLNQPYLNSRRTLICTRFGHQISALTFCHFQPFSHDNFNHFMELLHHVPNLKVIRLDGTSKTGTHHKRAQILERLPNLKHLELLDFGDYGGSPGPEDYQLGGILLDKYGPNLKALICEEMFLRAGNVFPSRLSHLSNLRCFRLEGWFSISHLELLTQLELPFLEDLQIFEKEKYFYKSDIGDQKQGMAFIRMLNRFANTLTHLQLLAGIPPYEGVPIEEDEEEANVVLHKLTRLSSRVFNVTSPWFRDVFLKKCPNLKKIVLERPGNDIERDLLENGVLLGFFEKLPNLEEVEAYWISHWKKPVAGLKVKTGSAWSVIFRRKEELVQLPEPVE